MQKRIVVAIDGPAGAGKSTIARRLAEKLGFTYIDTGAMYRAVALWAQRASVDLADMHRLERLAQESRIHFTPGGSEVFLNGEDITHAIRTPEISQAASKVSAVAGVRRALVEQQRRMGSEGSVVMEGRDIGTVVFPEAEVKVFLDARPEIRSHRRMLELQQKGKNVDAGEIHREMLERDQRDRGRAEAPLMQAPDAVYVDSSGLSPAEIEEMILKLIRDRTSNGKEVSR